MANQLTVWVIRFGSPKRIGRLHLACRSCSRLSFAFVCVMLVHIVYLCVCDVCRASIIVCSVRFICSVCSDVCIDRAHPPPYVWTWADDRYSQANCFTLVVIDVIDAEMNTTSRRRATLYMTLHICINVASPGGPKGWRIKNRR